MQNESRSPFLWGQVQERQDLHHEVHQSATYNAGPGSENEISVCFQAYVGDFKT